MQDHEGNTLAVGDNIWVPATITQVGTLNVTATLALGTGTIQVPGPMTHKDKPKSFPDLP